MFTSKPLAKTDFLKNLSSYTVRWQNPAASCRDKKLRKFLKCNYIENYMLAGKKLHPGSMN